MTVVYFTEEPARGEPVSGVYFERFWLPVVGPTSFAMMRLIDRQLETADPWHVELSDLALLLGLRARNPEEPAHVGVNHPVRRTLKRLTKFGLIRWGGSGYRVARQVAPVSSLQVERFPDWLAAQHRDLMDLVG